jgi:hypothetical protein
MAIGIVTGYAIKIAQTSADHTYVLSDAGDVWPCWGRSAHGREVCDGPAELNEADCLSQPSSKAGIRYGRTGVCHQTANRILYPSGASVEDAGGYRLSLFAFGTYGRRGFRFYSPAKYPWDELVKCLG